MAAGKHVYLAKPIAGCAYAPRCEFKDVRCETGDVSLEHVEANHASACLRVQKGELDLTKSNPVP